MRLSIHVVSTFPLSRLRGNDNVQERQDYTGYTTSVAIIVVS